MTIIVACKQNTNIFTTFLLINVLFIYTYWHFGSVKKLYFRTKKAPYIGICKFKVLLLSGRPWVRIPPGTPKKPINSTFMGFFTAHFVPTCIQHLLRESGISRPIMKPQSYCFWITKSYVHHISPHFSLHLIITLSIYTHLTKFKKDQAVYALNEHLDEMIETRQFLTTIQ